MITKVIAAIAAVGTFMGLIYLNNHQAKQLALHEAQLGQYSSLVNQMIEDQEVLYVQIAARDDVSNQYLDLIEDLNDEKTALTNQLNVASKRLYVNATCPVYGGTDDGDSSSPYPAGLPQFDATTRQDYLDFRVAYQLQYQAFKDLQQHVRTNCINKKVKY